MESSECRHSSKWIEYFEQERVVLQEIISGNEAGCDISRTGMEKRQNNILLRKGGERHERKVFRSSGDVMRILGISRSAAYKLMRQINSELEKEGLYCNPWKSKQKVF